MTSNSRSEDPRIISFQTLRKSVGWLGMSLAPSMLLGNIIFGCTSIQDSISHYYYTVTGDLFTGILCAVALFLFCYKGYDYRDRTSALAAGFFAVLIALFPTNSDSADSCAVFSLPLSGLRNVIHYGSAAIFFGVLAWMSLFLFTRSRGRKTKEKKVRNKIYLVCGVIILACIVLIAIYNFIITDEAWDRHKPVFWLEWIALIAFGTSWLVKGELVLKDGALSNR